MKRNAGELVQLPYLTCKKTQSQKGSRYPYVFHLQTFIPRFLSKIYIDQLVLDAEYIFMFTKLLFLS